MITLPKPRFRNYFRQDLVNNLNLRSDYGSIQLYRHHLITECVMYSCDMCLEFQRKSDGLLTSDWIEHIATEAVEAMRLLFPEDFDDSAANTAVSKVKTLMQFSAANVQEEVDRYYNRM